ncbi:MAG: hypothetical protein M5U12_08385 [Verrucomicrobia bacterium]|nr:hypothetical protein [Verrucomicrobiota bacterium]
MIAPSPDWFVGVDSLSLLEDGAWATPRPLVNGVIVPFGTFTFTRLD